jgi:uncharacterized membrane protein SpoIIM required for sporulation
VTPLRFETEYAPLWKELEAALQQFEDGRLDRRNVATRVDAARMAALYRSSCEHLALAQERAYRIGLIQHLQLLTYRAHRVIYRHQDFGSGRLRQLVLVRIPQAVRLHRIYLLAATLLLMVPTLLAGWTTYRDPTFSLQMLQPAQLEEFRQMYGGADGAIGPGRDAGADMGMFGYYILHNITLGFQCFAGGLFAGLGSVFFLVYNGLFGGVVAGYVTADGHALKFYSFIVTHSAFELTAICLSGAAGLRIGRAWLAPGRRTRLQSLKQASREAIVLVYAVFGFLVIAAAIEAFWSAAPWVAPSAKFIAGGVAWTLVIAYLALQGRNRPASAGTVPSGREPFEGTAAREGSDAH